MNHLSWAEACTVISTDSSVNPEPTNSADGKLAGWLDKSIPPTAVTYGRARFMIFQDWWAI
ncbi:hypothetical protein GJ744_009388 [Endocarpon pusillum]|uniref:Uncharacterized protein n=1 Tax=Endocarpon pusillum TaxID=364733 RepID=A0A8H7E4W1_9EURO|nr:hypothetical protein GJ744_009388 [Endocarpon pusillum]